MSETPPLRMCEARRMDIEVYRTLPEHACADCDRPAETFVQDYALCAECVEALRALGLEAVTDPALRARIIEVYEAERRRSMEQG